MTLTSWTWLLTPFAFGPPPQPGTRRHAWVTWSARHRLLANGIWLALLWGALYGWHKLVDLLYA